MIKSNLPTSFVSSGMMLFNAMKEKKIKNIFNHKMNEKYFGCTYFPMTVSNLLITASTDCINNDGKVFCQTQRKSREVATFRRCIK